jgi:signal transduction histidine kinase
MRSIRLSLIVYFLLLLIAAESVAFWLVYRSATDVLREKQDVNRMLLEAQYRESMREKNERFDNELLEQAREVAYLSSARIQRDQVRYTAFLPLMQMADVQAQWTLPFYVVEGTQPLFERGMRPAPWLRNLVVGAVYAKALAEENLPKGQPGETEYFQINWADRAVMWKSHSLAEDTLPIVERDFSPTEVVDWKRDNVTLKNGQTVRRVMLKLTGINPRNIFRVPPINPPGGRGAGRGGGRGGPDRGPPPPGGDFTPWIVVHAARNTGRRDAEIAGLETEKSEALGRLESEAGETLGILRNRLLGIGVGTISATMLGGLILIGYGLAPLQRLSDAVSRVSPSDFRLPLDPQEKLPSELAPIRERLEGTLGELGKAFDREKQASADISHELRTPVASLLTTVEVALKKPRTAEEYRRTLEECRTMGRQMRQLVERIMAIARLDAGSDRIKPRPVDVTEVVAESAALVRPLAAERGLELRVHCQNPLTVTTDPDKLREVLVNLLHNAVQYNKPHGAVDVAANRENGWVDLTVQDTGIGIQPEARNHIFERFYRVDASRHADDLHAGLGLSIVKGYVGLLGGTISVESEPGQGTTFRVRLPAA